jgi:hypothetical protein
MLAFGFPLFLLLFGWAEVRFGVPLFFANTKTVSPGLGVYTGDGRLSTKTLHEPRRRQFMTLRYPMGSGIRGHKTAFWGKQKNFNLFFFS